MATAGERSVAKREKARFCDTRTNDAGAKRNDVGVIVFTSGARRKLARNGRRSDTVNFVGGDRDSDPGSADEEAEPVPCCHAFRDGAAEVGVINRLIPGGAEILDLITERAQRRDELIFERPSRVIGTGQPAHRRHPNPRTA